jgi:pyruvate formate lyase activating enzyme
VELAGREGCLGISYSFNEPTLLLEHAVDTFLIAKRSGLYCNFVSNGYMTSEALRALRDAGMDAIKFDLKGDREVYSRFCNADVEVVWRNAAEARRMGLHIEVVTLLIPGVNDREETIRGIARRVVVELGPETPLHFARYYPAYGFAAPPTPVTTLEWAHRLAKNEGCRYVYVGNIPGHPLENTTCPTCGLVLVRRYGFEVAEFKLTPDHECPGCGLVVPVVGRYAPGSE